MHERFIAITLGHWGAGATQEEAVANMRKQLPDGRARPKFHIYKLTSELPFAPYDRDATEGEADCWIDKRGTLVRVRCDMTLAAEAVSKIP